MFVKIAELTTRTITRIAQFNTSNIINVAITATNVNVVSFRSHSIQIRGKSETARGDVYLNFTYMSTCMCCRHFCLQNISSLVDFRLPPYVHLTYVFVALIVNFYSTAGVCNVFFVFVEQYVLFYVKKV